MMLSLAEAAATADLGAALARAARPGVRIALQGDLGAGKTTLARGFLRACGVAGAIRSPTYTLIEPYPVEGGTVCHLDLYRLGDPEELEFLGLRDLLEPNVSLLVEWPERGAGFLPPFDLLLEMAVSGNGRQARLTAQTPGGEAMIRDLKGGD